MVSEHSLEGKQHFRNRVYEQNSLAWASLRVVGKQCEQGTDSPSSLNLKKKIIFIII